MAYSTSDFNSDAKATARTLHLAYRRANLVLDRWYAGMNNEFSGDTAMGLLMSRCEEIVADYEANGNAKLNTVMAKSDLTLPGDQD